MFTTDAVQLDGSSSSDPDGDQLSFLWSFLNKPASSNATLSDSTAVNPTFTVDIFGDYLLELTVNDGTDDSAPDTVNISTLNSAPVANAGPDQSVFTTDTVQLDASGSSDVDGDSLTFLWQFTSKPQSSNSTLSDPTLVNPTFHVDIFGEYILELTVNDATVDSDPDSVTISTLNSAPVANAGADQGITIPSTVQLDGSGSSDVDGNNLTFSWSFTSVPAGSTAVLNDNTIVNPTFNADIVGTYVVQLIVNDGTVDSGPDTVILTTTNVAPVADAGLDQTVLTGDTVILDGSGSGDDDSDPLTYSWSITSAPAGSTTTITNPTDVNPSFVVDVFGDYVLQLIVNDGTVNSAPDTVVISTSNSRPVSDAGPDQTVAPAAIVQLDGSGSFDVDSDPLTIDWALISIPNGSTASLSDNTILNPTFTVDIPGVYVAQLIVNDGLLNSEPDTVLITRTNIAPVLDPVGDQTVALGSSLTINLTASDVDGDTLNFTASHLPLPLNSSFNTQTGTFVFSPDATQIGDTVLTFGATDTQLSSTEQITITVTGTTGNTTITGQVLDANDAFNNITTPIVGAVVSILGSGVSTATDTSGNFTLASLPGGEQVLDVDATSANLAPNGNSYASFREALELIDDVVNNIDRPIFLPRIDPTSITTVDPNNTTIVTNPNLGVSITIAPGTAINSDGTPFTGDMSISLVPEGFAPAPLPETLEPGLLVTIQPVGISFTTPAPITFPNFDGLSPGSEVDIWSLDPDTGEFTIVGIGQVTPDGTQIVTISGGIIATDWHFPGRPPPAPGPPAGPGPPPGCGDDSCCTGDPNTGSGAGGSGGGGPGGPAPDDDPWGSAVNNTTGSLVVGHELVSYRSLNQTRALNFLYNSDFVSPRPIIADNAQIPIRASVPNAVSMSLTVAGVDQGTEVFTDTSGFNESIDEEFRHAIQFDATDFETGIYPYRLKVTSNYNVSRISSFRNGTVNINNQEDSSYGAGWSLNGIAKLDIQPTGDVLLIEGDGTLWEFEREIIGPIPVPGETFGTAIRIDGADDHAATGFNGIMNSLPLTVEAWVRPELNFEQSASINFRNQAVSNDRSGFAGHGFGLNTWQEDSNLFIEFQSPNGAFRIVPGIKPQPDEWHHVAVVYTVGNFKVYYDGVQVDDVSYTQGVLDGDGRVILGKHNLSGGVIDTKGIHKGLIDEVRVWSVARTGQEIADNMSRSLNGDEPGLQLYLPLNEGTGNVGFDFSGNGFNVFFGAGSFSPTWANFPTDTDDTFITPLGDYSTLERNLDGSFTRTLKSGTEIDFDQDGFQTSVVDRNGNTTSYGYDGNDNLTTIIDPVGMVTTLEYTNGLLTKVTDPAMRETLFEHDANGNLIKITDPDGTFRQFNYDSDHKLISKNSKRGFNTTYGYNFAGQNVSVSKPDGTNAFLNPAYEVGLPDISSGIGTKYNPAPAMREDDFVAEFIDGIGNVSTFKTNEFGIPTEFTDALNRTSTATRDSDNNATQRIDPRGNITEMTYDDIGNVLTITNLSIGATTTFTYTTDGFNNIKTITDPNNNTTTFTYDADGNQTEIIDPLTNKTTITYDSRGQVTSITDALTNIIAFNYDPVSGNQVGLTDRLQNDTLFMLDNAGNLTSVTDAESKNTQFVYDLHNRLIESIDADLASKHSSYNEEGFLTSITDARGKTTSFLLDNNNRVIKRTDPIGNFDNYIYDNNYNLTSIINRNDDTITFEYDSADQMIKKTLPGNVLTSLDYDLSGNLISISNPDSNLTMTYDALSRLQSSSTSGSPIQPDVNLTYTYDLNNNRKTMTDSISGTTDYVYDALNRVTLITNPSSLPVTFSYDVLNRLTQTTFTNGVVSSQTYDAKSQISSVVHSLGANTNSSFDYSYNGVGIRTSLNTTRSNVTVNNTLSYVYDNIFRLTLATNPLLSTPDESFSYDTVGNRLTKQGQTTQSVFDDANRLLEDENFIYTYDLNGNMISKTDKSTNETTQYTYNAENQLSQIIKPGMTAIYKYDGFRRRIEKNVNGDITRYVHDDVDILFEFDGTNAQTARYTFGLGIDRPLIMERNGNTFYYQTDVLGSIIQLTDAIGNIAQSYVYNSFGKIVLQVGGVDNPFTYTAREFDSESGIYNYRFRYYDAEIGRFISEDPIGFIAGVNFYTYVTNNPLFFVDPYGLYGFRDLCAAFLAGGFGYAGATIGVVVGTLAAPGPGTYAGGVLGAVAGLLLSEVTCKPIDCAINPGSPGCPKPRPCVFQSADGKTCYPPRPKPKPKPEPAC